MKIILINKFYYLKGGAERYYFDLKKLLEDHGHTVIPFAMASPRNFDSPYAKYFVSEVDFGQPVYSLDGLKTAGRMFYSFEARDKLEALIKNTRPDLVHFHNIYHQISPSILPLVKKKYRLPLVESVHDYKLICPNYLLYTEDNVCERCNPRRYYQAVLHRCLKNSLPASILASKEMYFHHCLWRVYEKYVDRFIVPSRFVAKEFVKFKFRAVNKIVRLAHFGDFQNFRPGPNDRPGGYYLFFGRLNQEKGIKILLEAAARLPRFRLHLAGSGPMEEWVKSFIAKNNLSHVKFLGRLETPELITAIRGAAFVVIPSRVFEAFGLVALEAMACGKAVLGSDRGAIPELIQPQKTGLLFDPDHPNDLTNKISQMFQDPARLQDWGRAARQFVTGEFDRQKHYQDLMKIYQQVRPQKRRFG